MPSQNLFLYTPVKSNNHLSFSKRIAERDTRFSPKCKHFPAASALLAPIPYYVRNK